MKPSCFASKIMGGAQSQEESIFTDEGSGKQTPKLYASTQLASGQWPIIYSKEYNIGFLGLERIHPFDSGKWGKIFTYLKGTASHTNIDFSPSGNIRYTWRGI